jgi:hypothetical protein
MALVNSSTGEITNPIAGFWESKEVDSTQFVKLYASGVRVLKELSNAGTKAFEVLYFAMQNAISKDTVLLSFKLVDQKNNKMSVATYERGIRELIAKDFIAPTTIQSVYWINPDFVFNGDRLAFVREYRKTPTPNQPTPIHQPDAVRSS